MNMPVFELLNKMSSYEISEWNIYYKIKAKEEKKMEDEIKSKSRGRRG